MARLARIVIPGVPHHVTQCGNRGQQVFFGEDDAAAYVALIAASLRTTGTRCMAWCLMPAQVHLILVPRTEDGLRAALAEAHRRYSRGVNAAHGWTGYLWQGRFASYPMQETYLRSAALHVERGPVAARLAVRAEDWRWSSAKAHVGGQPDGLTDLKALDLGGAEWRRELAADAAHAELFEAHLRTGRPLGDSQFVAGLEAATGRTLAPQKRGRKPGKRKGL